jgi:hypothetical protein
MLRVRTGRASQVLRITVAALLFLSCTRIVRPLASWSADKSSALATRCMQVARSSVLEVGGGGAKLVRPSALRFREVLLSLAPTLSVLKLCQRFDLVRIWPEHQQSFIRRILPPASDASH